jgi:phosphatidylglycerophosphatase C
MTVPTPDQAIASSDRCDASKTLAIFDLDGTLVTRDSFLPFLVSYALQKRRYGTLFVMPFWIALYIFRLISARTVKEKVLMLVFRGENRVDIARHAEAFCSNWVKSYLNETVVDRLRDHLGKGHRVILLSASPDIYVPVIGKSLGISEAVCTRVGWNNDICTGQILGPNCKGEEKIRMLCEYLQLEGEPGPSYAYGDSKSDLPLLRWVNQGFLVKNGGITAVSLE